MSKARSSYAKTLRRRMEYLEDKAKGREFSDNSRQYMLAEIAALKFAIGLIEELVKKSKEAKDDQA